MNTSESKDRVRQLILEQKKTFRPSLSLRFPKLIPLIIEFRKRERKCKHYFYERSATLSFARERRSELLPFVISRHTSPLYRKLDGVSNDTVLGKIENLKIATSLLTGLIIKNGETFSLWEIIGNPTKERGFKDGLLLSQGKQKIGVGGGLCQLANLLTWLILHSKLTLTERHHHSFDAFPDSGRTIPFGTGSTIYYPTLDLCFKNTSGNDIQLELWLTETQLCGKLRSVLPQKEKYHIYAEDEYFLKVGAETYRHNIIYRDKITKETTVKERLAENIFLVKYDVSPERLRKA